MTTVPTIPNVNVLILKQVQNDSSRYVLIYVDSSSKEVCEMEMEGVWE